MEVWIVMCGDEFDGCDFPYEVYSEPSAAKNRADYLNSMLDMEDSTLYYVLSKSFKVGVPNVI